MDRAVGAMAASLDSRDSLVLCDNIGKLPFVQ
jgi:hypothetical protein